jgi:endonuclease-8
MPEGTMIHRTAAAMRTALVDEKMVRFEAPRLIGVVPRAGRTIEAVESHGRHLEVRWDDGIILHTNLRLSGSWHLYRTGESWQLPHREVRALIEVEGWRAVCFNAPVVETYRVPDALRHPGLRGVGPDLSRPDADLHRCVELLRAYDDPNATLAEVLLDPLVFFGVGNVFRCEVLWAGQLSPFARVGDLPQADAVRLVNVAAKLVRANLTQASRPTVPGVERFAVYGRPGQRCWRCGDTIASRRTGEQSRILYWCPGCQVRFDPRRSRRDDTQWMDEPELVMDPHPAARRFLAERHWHRAG